jgi:Holliday junction DNA helicase RuvA
LTTVQGVGAKASMAILGTLGADGVARAIAIGDWGAVKAAPGIGPKLAQRVVNELKDKAPGAMALGGTMGQAAGILPDPLIDDDGPAKAPAAPPAPSSGAATADALSALTNLGYAPSEAARAVSEAAGASPDADASTLIRAALRLLAPKE